MTTKRPWTNLAKRTLGKGVDLDEGKKVYEAGPPDHDVLHLPPLILHTKELTNGTPVIDGGEGFDEGTRVGQRPGAWTNFVQGSRGGRPLGLSLGLLPVSSALP